MASLHPVSWPNQRLRIAVLNRHFSATGGGAERYSMALVEHLAAQHEIHVFAQHIDHDWPGVTYHKVSQPFGRPRWMNQLWYATASWWATHKGFDVVHSHENTWQGQVQTVHVLPVKYNLFHGRKGWSRVLRWLKVLSSPRLMVYLGLERSRFSLVSPRTIVLASQTLVGQTLEAYPACQDVVQVITPGVDRVYGPASDGARKAARQQLGLPESGQCILFIGNDYKKKGLETLLKALKQLPETCYLAVVGNPAQVPLFKAQALADGVSERVNFLGSLSDTTPAYMAANCLAHPTREDTFAMVVLEAMAHGLPVVVSAEKYCGIARLLRQGHDALLLENPFNADALTGALREVMCDGDVSFKLQAAGLVFAAAHQWSTLAQQQAEIYQAMAAQSA